MNKITRNFLQKSLLFVCLAAVAGQPVFGKAKKKNSKQESGQVKSTFDGNPETSTIETEQMADGSVKLITQKPTFFSKIEPELLEAVEIGSPDSIKIAMQKIRKNESEYQEADKVLMAVSAEIFKTVWSSEKITWEVPSIGEENPYTGAIATASKGVFDSSTGNIDFLSILLPALVVFKPVSDLSVYDQCEQALMLALAKRPDSILANYMLGCVYEKKQNLEKAIDYYKKAYTDSPKTREIILAYANMLRLSGDYETSSKLLATVAGAENDVTVLKQNAYVAFAADNIDMAEQYVARVLQQNPNDLEFVLFRAKILVRKNDYIHAVSLLDVYARQNPNSLDYLLLRAQVQLDWSKNTSAATETVEKALQLYPDSTEVLIFAARISSLTDSPVAGKYADQLASIILEKDPKNKDALFYALNGLVQRENWKEAYEVSSKLISSKPVNPELVKTHVTICIKLNKKIEAFEFAKRTHEEYPDNEEITQAYVLAYCQTGARDVVIKYLDSQISSAGTTAKMKSYLYYRRSFLQYSEEASLADLRSSLISNPRNSDSLFRLYEIYYARSDYRKAQYYLRQVVAINPNDNSVKQLNEALTKLIQ